MGKDSESGSVSYSIIHWGGNKHGTMRDVHQGAETMSLIHRRWKKALTEQAYSVYRIYAENDENLRPLGDLFGSLGHRQRIEADLRLGDENSVWTARDGVHIERQYPPNGQCFEDGEGAGVGSM